MTFDNVLNLIKANNYQILRIETKMHSRKKDSIHHKKGEISSYKNIICKCPTEGCDGTIKIARERDLMRSPKCKHCAIKGSQRKDKRVQVWQVLTTDVTKATTVLAKANPERFIREEGTLTVSKGLAKRVILKCAAESCNRTISTNVTNRTTPKHDYCNSCCRKGKPFERTYNHAIANTKRRSEIRNKNIQWFLSYDEFVYLCQIPNCRNCRL